MKRKKEKEPNGNEDLILRKEAMNASSLSSTETFQLKKGFLDAYISYNKKTEI